MNFAMVFPGQGSQSLGMLSALAEEHPLILGLFSKASDVLGYDLWPLTQEGPEEKLNATAFTQPALLAADVAVFQCWQEQGGPLPFMMAGHSLGEYSALVCASALSFEDGIRLVAKRGECMQQAVNVGDGAMAAIIGLDDATVTKICEQAVQGDVLSPANYNALGQVVVAGHTSAVERAVVLAKEQGAKLAKLIPVSVPSHCALMQPAAEQLAEAFARVTFSTPVISVIQNADVACYEKPDDMKEALIKQLTHPVRWVETVQKIMSEGAAAVIECGPGKVLTGLNKRIDRGLSVMAVNTPESMAAAIEAIEE